MHELNMVFQGHDVKRIKSHMWLRSHELYTLDLVISTWGLRNP